MNLEVGRPSFDITPVKILKLQRDSVMTLRQESIVVPDKLHDSDLIDKGNWSMISAAMLSYSSSDTALRSNIRLLIHQSFLDAVKSSNPPTSANHTEVIIFMTPLDLDLTRDLLDKFKDWSAETHAISYHINWSYGNESERSRGSSNERAQNAERVIQSAYEKTLETNDLSIEPLLGAYLDDSKLDLQTRLLKRHWITSRLKFEASWRSLIESPLPLGQISDETLDYAVELLDAITTLALYFDESEYAWYWTERTVISRHWRVLINMISICRVASQGSQKDIWRGRSWVVYKYALDYPHASKISNPLYVKFMKEFILFLNETETSEQCLVALPRIYTDMLSYCSSTHFCIPSELLEPILDICWRFRFEPKQKWEHAFRKIFEVYVLYKFYSSRRDTTYRGQPYFNSKQTTLLLSLCTTAGFLDEFSILNRNLLIGTEDEEFVSRVQIGYGKFLSSRTLQMESVGIIKSKELMRD